MKKTMLYAAALFLCGTYGCERSDGGHARQRNLRVDVRVETEMVTRSAATAEENRVDSYDLYLFDAGTELLEQTVIRVRPATGQTLAGAVSIGEVSFALNDAKPKHLLAIANGDASDIRIPDIEVGVTTYASMMESTVRASDGVRLDPPLAMSGYVTGFSPVDEAVTLSLVRRVAKLSVENRDTNGNLVITSLRLRQSSASYCLFKAENGPDGALYTDGPTVDVQLAGGASEIFYLLPQSLADNRAQLEIGGLFYGQPFTQTLALEPLDASGQQVAIDPNNHYTVVLTAADRTVQASVGVRYASEWNDGGEIGGVVTGDNDEEGDILFNGLYWMNRNIGASSADLEGEWGDVRGAFFQWGRNIAFLPEEYSTVSGPLSAEEAAANPDAFITRMSGDWLSPSDDTLWATADRQPCPDGYRLPTEQELFGIFSSSGVLFNMYNGPKIVSGETNPKGSGTAHYFGDNTNKALYGIKLQGTAEAYLLKWEYLKSAAGNAYARICRWTGDASASFSGKSLSEVRDEFDALGDPEEELTLPCSGYLTGSNGGYSDNKGGYYWASSPNGAGAWRAEITDGKMIMTTPYNSRVSGHSLRCVKE